MALYTCMFLGEATLTVHRRLSTRCNLVVVTSRQHAIAAVTQTWLALHFPGIFGAGRAWDGVSIEFPMRCFD